MKAKKQTERRLIATVTFEVFENADGSLSHLLTIPGGIAGFGAINLLENHLYRIKTGTAKPVKGPK